VGVPRPCGAGIGVGALKSKRAPGESTSNMSLLNTSWKWLRRVAGRPADVVDEAPAVAQARALIRAVDAGGLPLHPGKVNQLARALGLEVSGSARVEDTIARIRQALMRV
jgi:hypothetical protein